ncbi:hypothetical protein [Streptomyces sp. CNQ431]|uniref:hypothetical protein n=1 Tax=Streptomyces sp. CNQ431 TaxID=1571532 RepID=UPI0012FF2707|nr:hypothetical protein [Streptomyces sp. CNQ431]
MISYLSGMRSSPAKYFAALRRISRSSGSLARSRTLITRSLQLLAWLDDEGIALADLTQPTLDRWLAQDTRRHVHIRTFLRWAQHHKLTRKLHVPVRRVGKPSLFIADDDRVQQLRRCVHDTSIPLTTRVAGSLVLLLGLQISRILRLTTGEVSAEQGMVRLHLNGHQVDLPPRISDLVQQLVEQAEAAWHESRSASTTPWLFPGHNPARPLKLQSIVLQFRKHGLNGLAGRNTARLALAADVPASILAELTGTSVSNATRWAALTKRDWTGYLATRQEPDA